MCPRPTIVRSVFSLFALEPWEASRRLLPFEMKMPSFSNHAGVHGESINESMALAFFEGNPFGRGFKGPKEQPQALVSGGVNSLRLLPTKALLTERDVRRWLVSDDKAGVVVPLRTWVTVLGRPF